MITKIGMWYSTQQVINLYSRQKQLHGLKVVSLESTFQDKKKRNAVSGFKSSLESTARQMF
jgi:hypothetical protein